MEWSQTSQSRGHCCLIFWEETTRKTPTLRLSRPVVLNLFYVFYPFIKQDYQIYPQWTQWCSFIENTKVTNFDSLEWFTFAAINVSVNLPPCKVKFTPLQGEIYPQGWIYPRLRITARELSKTAFMTQQQLVSSSAKTQTETFFCETRYYNQALYRIESFWTNWLLCFCYLKKVVALRTKTILMNCLLMQYCIWGKLDKIRWWNAKHVFKLETHQEVRSRRTTYESYSHQDTEFLVQNYFSN